MTATQRFDEGYNCAQAVFLSHAHHFNIDPEAARCLAASLGGGIGGLRRTCGALTAVCLLAGLKHGGYDIHDANAKARFYERIQEIEAEFVKEFGTSLCAELLAAEENGGERPCDRCVQVADRLASDLLSPAP